MLAKGNKEAIADALKCHTHQRTPQGTRTDTHTYIAWPNVGNSTGMSRKWKMGCRKQKVEELNEEGRERMTEVAFRTLNFRRLHLTDLSAETAVRSLRWHKATVLPLTTVGLHRCIFHLL